MDVQSAINSAAEFLEDIEDQYDLEDEDATKLKKVVSDLKAASISLSTTPDQVSADQG